MARIVQKYGGTSVGDIERIKNVAERIKACRSDGNELVVVLSARAGVTNELIARAKGLCAEPSARELDQLLAPHELTEPGVAGGFRFTPKLPEGYKPPTGPVGAGG